MDSQTGRETAPVIRRLERTPADFTLGQAVRLLGMSHTKDYAAWLRFLHKHVRVRPWLSLAFPATELTACTVTYDSEDAPPTYQLTDTAFGLYSTLGPLPTFYTEELMEEARRDESVSRDFLDIINNHLQQCLFLAQLHSKPVRQAVELQNPQTNHVLYCLMGQAYPALRPKGSPQVALLQLLLRHTRSAMGLEIYLARLLQLAPVWVEQCVPRMASIPEDQRCQLGTNNTTLGHDSVLGSHIADRTGKFRIHFYNLDEQDMVRFLPDSAEYAALRTHVSRFLDVPLEFDVVLHPAAKPVRAPRLGEDAR
ncbi:MAG: type VI secretion system baseplate subunit TssG, partial [Bilophila sp.]